MSDSPQSSRSQAGPGSDSGGIKAPSESVQSVGGNQADVDRLPPTTGPLQTLHEDTEISFAQPESSTKSIPLTLKTLMATKDDRLNVESRPVTGSYSG